jgi:hypothetical protein
MTYRDRDPYRDDEQLQTGPILRSDPTVRASANRAVWSWITGLAIVFVLFMVFYGINSQRDSAPVTTAGPPAAATSPPSTTGQGGSPSSGAQQDDGGAKTDAPQDQGAPKDQGAPAGEGGK